MPLSNFKHSKSLFTVKYPTGWAVQENAFVASFSAPNLYSPQPATFNVAVVPLEQNLPLEEITRKIIGESQVMPNFQLISTEDILISGYPAKLLQYVLNIPQMRLAFVQAITVTPQGNMCTASFSGIEEDLQQYAGLFKEIFQSLSLEDREVLVPIDSLYLQQYEKDGFSVLHPITWTVSDVTKEAEADPRIVSATEMSYEWKQSKALVSLGGLLVVEKLPETIKNLDEYLIQHDWERTKELSHPGVKDTSNRKVEKVKMGGKDGRFIIYLDPITKKKTWRAFTIHNSRVFVLSFFSTGPESDKREAPMITRILDSFQLVDKPDTPRNTVIYENLLLHFGLSFNPQQSPPTEHPAALLSLTYLPSSRDPESIVFLNVFAKEEETASLKEFAEQSLAILRNELPVDNAAFNVSPTKDITIGGLPGLENVIETVVEHTKFCLTRRVFMKDGVGFTMTIEGRASDITPEISRYFSGVMDSVYFFPKNSVFTSPFSP
jgi:hypothetical protein